MTDDDILRIAKVGSYSECSNALFDAAGIIAELRAALEAERNAMEEAEQDYENCKTTLKDERYCHAQTIASLKQAASEEIKAANGRAKAAEARVRELESDIRTLIKALPGPPIKFDAALSKFTLVELTK